jgi:hypothetical protein
LICHDFFTFQIAILLSKYSNKSKSAKLQHPVFPRAEYGYAGAGAKDEGIWRTKKLLEKGVKAAKTLKDMFNHLFDLVDNEETSVRELRTFGNILSGILLVAIFIGKNPL